MKKAILVMCLISSSAIASNWTEVARGGDKAIYYIDTDSITKVKLQDYSGFSNDDTFISAFVQPVYTKGSEYRAKKGVYYQKQQWFVSCQNKRYIMNGSVSYDNKDKIIHSWQLQKSTFSADDWEIAYPDTLGYATIEAICYLAEPPPKSKPGFLEKAFDDYFEQESQRSAAEKVADAADEQAR